MHLKTLNKINFTLAIKQFFKYLLFFFLKIYFLSSDKLNYFKIITLILLISKLLVKLN